MKKARLIYATIVLISLFICVYIDKAVSLTFLLLFIILPLVTFFVTLCIKEFFLLNFDVKESEVEKNSPINIIVNINNSSFIGINYVKLYIKTLNTVTRTSDLHELIVPINGNYNTRLSFNINTQHCGNIEFSIYKIRIYDILSLTSVTKNCDSSFNITVLPETLDIAFNPNYQTSLTLENAETIVNKKGTVKPHIFDIKEYSDGDNIKDIHWKLSSKLNKFMVKEYSKSEANPILISYDFFDIQSENIIDLYDLSIQSLATISSWLTKISANHEILIEDTSTNEIYTSLILNNNNLIEMIKHIYTMQLSSSSLTLKEIRRLSLTNAYKDVIYITNYIDINMLDDLIFINKTTNLKLVLIGDKLVDEYVKSIIVNNSINLINVETETIITDLQKVEVN